jgi:DNA-binding transcriptional MerR regulator
MAGDALMTIGELARLAGLTVKTVRFWSDEGLVPPDGRTPAGYRLYGPEALVRLGLVSTLRDLGVDLATIRKILGRELTIGEVAARHATAPQVQIRALRLHQAVLNAIAGRGTATEQEIQLMHKLARLSAADRRSLITEFIDDTFTGLDLGPDFVPMMRRAMPDLPDEPTQQQVGAWVELAGLVQDPDFRASIRQAAVAQARAREQTPADPGPEAHHAMATLLRERVAAATDAGITPGSPQARPIADELVAAYARHTGRESTPEFRAWLLDLMESASDPRYERYWQLLAIINGWPGQPSITPAAEWLIAALRSY